MSERGFFSASNDIKTLDGNIFSGFPWLTTHLHELIECRSRICVDVSANLKLYRVCSTVQQRIESKWSSKTSISKSFGSSDPYHWCTTLCVQRMVSQNVGSSHPYYH